MQLAVQLDQRVSTSEVQKWDKEGQNQGERNKFAGDNLTLDDAMFSTN